MIGFQTAFIPEAHLEELYKWQHPSLLPPQEM